MFEPDDDERHRQARHQRDRRKSRIAGWVVFGVIIAILGGLTAGGFYVWNTYEDKIREFMGWEEPRDYEAGMATGEVVITIADGDIPATISQTLYDAGVTKTPTAFYRYLVDQGLNPTFYPGSYQLQQQMTSEAALAALEDPANKLENTAQLREGLTVDESLSLLADGTGIPLEDFQAAVADASVYGITPDPDVVAAGGQPLEGWLFPATYTFDPGTTAQQVIQTLVDRTVQSLDAVGVPVDQRQEILTIASIIQREARLEDDFYKVSRVISNRIADGMQLQMDSTAQYGYGEMHDGTASSSAEALADDNPWNTYVVDGLPVGPISNPGDTAIDAAMNPAEGDWLYFVTWNMDTGETIFSATYAEHQAGIAKWDAWCAANDNRGC
ncbi:MAG: ABC transporter substrate-binding protein [Microbacterium sp. SCN 70-200]|nr:MAG: ABC transporter substrate-binding protein [Microbacterium sp. SCN 70-200]OJV84174.1 MAG: ABC transporter substrate-binding protein [Microbacterium sp. 70-16]